MIHAIFYGALVWVLYGAMFAAFLASILWRPIVGILYVVPMLPLSALRYRLHELPLGSQFTDFLLLGIIIGLLRRGDRLPFRNLMAPVMWIFAVYTYVSLWMPVFFSGFDAPLWFSDLRLSDWKNDVVVPMVVFLCMLAVSRSTRDLKLILLVMCLSMALLNRSLYHSSKGHMDTYRDDARSGQVTLGMNQTGSLEAQFCMFLLALRACEKNRWVRLGCLALGLLSGYCVLASFSRGAYAALLAGWLVLGVLKQRILLVLLAIFMVSWQAVVPAAVRERILMTYSEDVGFDGSAVERLSIWDDAIEAFQEEPVFGRGFNTYKQLARIGWKDTHNYYLKVIFEVGIVGLAVFLALWAKLFRLGFRLFRGATDPYLSGIGLGLVLWMTCAAVGNMFGDRWNYIQISGYLWAITAMVVRGLMITEQTNAAEEQPVEEAVA